VPPVYSALPSRDREGAVTGNEHAISEINICYNRNVREIRITRALVALICIVLLLLCTAFSPSAACLNLAIPVLAFCFSAVLTPSLLSLTDGDPAAQLLPFLTVRTSRAPPLA